MLSTEVTNFLYIESKQVQFLHVHQEEISLLYESLRQFGRTIQEQYEHEDYLMEMFKDIRKGLNRFFTSFDKYNILFDKYFIGIVQQFRELKIQYTFLFDTYGRKILLSLKEIKHKFLHQNFLQKEVQKHLNSAMKQCIVTRFDSSVKKIGGIPIFRASEYLNSGQIFDEVFIIGSPAFFDARFSRIFLAKKTYFVSYDIFQNKIYKTKLFKNINTKDVIDKSYDNIKISRGMTGQIFEMDFGRVQEEKFQKEEILTRHKENAQTLSTVDKVEANLIVLGNQCYTFVPVNGNVRKINRESMHVINAKLREVESGDWLLFRNNTNRDLIIDVANKLMGEEHIKHRKLQKKWKNRLRYLMENHHEDKVINYLKRKGITTANHINLRNWINEGSISTKAFDKLLSALKFNEEMQKKILDSSKVLKSNHIQAGRFITKKLINELDDSIIENLADDGYATFTSPIVEGASFNVEIIKEIDYTSIEVANKDIFTIWRNE